MYESKPLKEQELRKSLSQMSLEERKMKKISQKNSTRNKAVSAAANGGTTRQQTNERSVKKTEGITYFACLCSARNKLNCLDTK